MIPERPTPMLSVYDGCELLGHLVDRGEAGVEAFDVNDHCAGVFKNQETAATELWRRARGQT